MKPLYSDTYALLKLVGAHSPYTQKLSFKDLQKHKKILVKQRLIELTGEDGQWERMFPTEAGKLWLEWQTPLENKRRVEVEAAKRLLYLSPANDGKTHINVYSGGKTELGQKLSNFDFSKLKLPEGTFSSVEAYWYYWLCKLAGVENAIGLAALKTKSGVRAKEYGRNLLEGKEHVEVTAEMQEAITAAIRLKIHQSPMLQEMMKRNTLPYEHYYTFGRGKNPKVVEPQEHKWVLDVIRQKAKEVKNV